MQYTQLGNSGLRVSRLCLGTMTFGSGFRNVGSTSQSDANEIVKYAYESGINFFDTADIYSQGDSETVLGKAIKANNIPRDRIIVATKVRGTMGDDINNVGLSRHHILNSCDASLARLQIDYIDLYQVHNWDPATPLEETMQALNDLVRAGKVRYIGVSNFSAWQIQKANGIARRHGWARFITMQGYYSLVGRTIEHEIVPLCEDQGMGILPWSPLAGGMLSGKYRKDKPMPQDTRMAGELGSFIPVDKEQLYRILDVADVIAATHNVPVAAVALAWLRQKRAVTSVIIGARTMAHLVENIKAADVVLTAQEMAKLDDVSKSQLPYPQWMFEWTLRDRLPQSLVRESTKSAEAKTAAAQTKKNG